FGTAVFGTRILRKMWVKSGYVKERKSWLGVKSNKIHDIKDGEEFEPTFLNRTIDVVKHQKKIFIITIGMIVIGTETLLIYDSITTEEVESDLESLGLEAKSIVLSGENEEIAVSRFDTVLEKDKINEIKNLYDDRYGKEPSVSVVSPIVGEELVKNALYALGI